MNKRTWVFIAVMIGLIGGGLFYRHLAQDVDSRGATRLMRAIEENDDWETGQLLQTEDVNVRDKAGHTALFYAARHATNPKTIYRLIVAGADPLATDKDGNTPLTTAAKYNSSSAVVMALAKQGHNQAQQTNKNKALQRAAKYNSANIIKTLLIAHANPAPKGEPSVVGYLADNEKLTGQEKIDYRQAMLVLEILEAREQFAKSMKGAGFTGEVTAKAHNKENPSAGNGQGVSTVQQTHADASPIPQEKQMRDEVK
jgi:ankyrin repeat protein